MSKTTLAIISILVVLMGIIGFVRSWVDQPTWYSIVQIVIGVIGLAVAVSDRSA